MYNFDAVMHKDELFNLEFETMASLGEEWTAPGDTRLKLIFLWPNLERTLNKRCGKVGKMGWRGDDS